jgi:hypothetical protein
MAIAVARDGARPRHVISSRVFVWQIVAFRISVPGWPARADGGCGVVAGVVETPWTGSDTRDAVRHRDVACSANAGLDMFFAHGISLGEPAGSADVNIEEVQ